MPEHTTEKPFVNSLITKLVRIMESVERIPKLGFNDFHKYQYATEADVSDHVRKVMAEYNVLMITDVEDADIINIESVDKKTGETKSTPITRLKIRFTFYDGDSDERLSFCMFSDGQDAQDKGCYKAITGGVKYALMKTFLIPTGDDPEKDKDYEGSGKAKRQPKQPESTKKTDEVDDRDRELQKKLGDMLMDLAGGDKEKATDKLEKYSAYDNDLGEKMICRTLSKLKGTWLRATYGRAKQDHQDWEKKQPHENEIPF